MLNIVHKACVASLTYDDVRVAGGTLGVCGEVALDLVGSLIEQVKVVFHRVSVVETLAETNDA